jgi:hypothetical protein
MFESITTASASTSVSVRGFPRCDDAPPLAVVVEGQGAPEPEMDIHIQQVDLPPLRRAWLINEQGTNLIQIQEDRFLFNWKKGSGNAPYVGYPKVVSGFHEQWNRYKAFLRAELSEPVPTQLEMTYWNFLAGSWELLRDHRHDPSDDSRFLPPPEVFNWRSTFSLPEGMGRLHVTATSARLSARESLKKSKSGTRWPTASRERLKNS